MGHVFSHRLDWENIDTRFCNDSAPLLSGPFFAMIGHDFCFFT